MVTNLTQEAKAKWAEAIAEKNPKAKLRLLREFYSLMPHHKGTKKLEMSIKRQISSLEEEVERARSRRTGRTRLEWVVRKEALPQLALVGPWQATTSLFNFLTNSRTRPHEALMRTVVGVFKGRGVQFQLLLTPYDRAIGEGKLELFAGMVRNVDGLLIALDDDPLGYLREVEEWFEGHNIDIRSEEARVEIAPTHSGGIRIVGSSNACSEREIVDFLSGYRIKNAIVKVTRTSTLDDVEVALFGRVVKRAIFIALNRRAVDELKGLIQNIVVGEGLSLDELVASILKGLKMIRIYTKGRGEGPADRPLLVREGAKVIEVAEQIHRDLVKLFQYARVWREGSLDGIRVGRAFELRDGDVVEVHSS